MSASNRPFAGTIARLLDDSEPSPLTVEPPPPGAPNVLVVLLDDVGFGSCSTFGGPVPTPALDRVAAAGLRYTQFHTTALCSPTRASLLTGRNHHTVHMGGIPENANSFPGYDSAIPREAATVADLLRRSGYATGCFGKWHLTPMWEQNPAGPFDHWPTGMGFDRFYGFINAEASLWEPALYDQTTPVMPYVGRDDYHLTEDLAEQTIAWVRRHLAAGPDRPFFAYLAPGAMHCPHHVWREWSDRFAGEFDDGWDALRERIHASQLELGVIPPGTALTPRPDQIPSWDDYPERYRPVARRLMEVFAGFLAHTDAQVGRVLDALDELGVGDNTLVVYITGDNGASGEGTIHGAWSAPSFQNGLPEDPEWLLEHIDDFGTPRCENHYNVGWAWALDSPFQWMKQVASHFGGTRNAMAVSWPARLTGGGEVRPQFHHIVDIAPTILEAAGVRIPDTVDGIVQLPVEGVSMLYTFDQADAPSRRTTQYFEILGNRAIYHDGWIASCFHGRPPWIRLASMPFDGPQERWELYRIDDDFSQAVDLADTHPEKLAELQALFDAEARRNGVYPMRDPALRRDPRLTVPTNLAGRTRMTYTRDHVRMPEASVVNLKNCSFRITAELDVPASGARGVVACQGGNMAGWSLYLDEQGRVVYHYNWFGHEHTSIATAASLLPGRRQVVVDFAYDGGFGAGGEVLLRVDGHDAAAGRVPRTIPLVFSMSGETFDVGVDTGSAVGPYPHGFECTARILGVTLERLSEPPAELAARIAAGEHAAGLATH
jgi:arylsulfatase